MWHLILPPIIIVVSLVLLLWYLSRRIADPELLEKLEVARANVGSDAKARALSRKEFLLKLSERSASWFKVASLRIHNFFQYSVEHIRERRKKVQELRRVAENVSASAKERISSVSKPCFPLVEVKGNTGIQNPIGIRSKPNIRGYEGN